MKRIVLALAFLIFATISTSHGRAAAPATQPSLERENAELRTRVAALEAKLAEMQARVRQLEAMKLSPGSLRLNLGTGRYEVAPQLIVPAPLVTPPGMPRGSVPQRFNDGTFYLVPLN